MTELELVQSKLNAGWGWQSIGHMFGMSGERAKAKWEIIYDPPVCLPDLALERAALLIECERHRQFVIDGLERVAEIDRIIGRKAA